MVIYGINPIIESLRSAYLPETVYLAARKKNPKLSRIQSLAEKQNVKVQKEEDIASICKTNEHQGVCAKMESFRPESFYEKNLDMDRIVMMDGIQDPHNFGAALRVSEVFGINHIVYHNGDSSGITPAAIKVSAGAAFHLNLYEANLNMAMKRLKAAGFPIFVLDGQGDYCISNFEFPSRLCLVIGSEKSGVRFSIRRQAEKILRIPVFGKIESLNVSCALSAALYELSRSRRGELIEQ